MKWFYHYFKKTTLFFLKYREKFKKNLFWNSRSRIYSNIQAPSQRKWGQAWGIKSFQVQPPGFSWGECIFQIASLHILYNSPLLLILPVAHTDQITVNRKRTIVWKAGKDQRQSFCPCLRYWSYIKNWMRMHSDETWLVNRSVGCQNLISWSMKVHMSTKKLIIKGLIHYLSKLVDHLEINSWKTKENAVVLYV